ncbi:MAG TPA: sigma-70 family RNA polymerase sigma factor [Polyangiaceae bacterium]
MSFPSTVPVSQSPKSSPESSPAGVDFAYFTSCNDMDMIAGLLENRAEAWRALTLRYGRLIQSCISRVVSRFPSVVRAEDTAEIYSMLYLQLLANDRGKLRSFAPERGSRLSTWLGLLATHTAYDFLRTIRRIPRTTALSEAEELACETPDPVDVTLVRERSALVDDALASFTSKDRQFVELYFGEGLDPDEVARRMGISVKTVYSKRHKIQRRLQSLFGPALAA